MALLDDLQQRLGVTIIIATHDEEISSHTEPRIRLRDGVIVPDSRN
jgi:ABC-type lipoprotein export system ATPase subunit